MVEQRKAVWIVGEAMAEVGRGEQGPEEQSRSNGVWRMDWVVAVEGENCWLD